ncbi:nucleoporin-like protein [Calycina marina]|uniref:Nucleoporin NUP188 n=1 Tax=Calycina marina TaxID=1763456 RepID=A0A9P7Z5H9_9HELO|nr:nucleoporin-like protein [Calycina marina]
MAPMSDSSYFPSLDKCLQGDQLLISWKTAFYAILDGEECDGTQSFFEDQDVKERLSLPYDAFPQPSQQTKSAFETKTSAINITPTPDSLFDIKEIKEDAVWLSAEAQLDEITSLRVVVQEFQSRAYAGLLGRFSHQELIGIQEAGDQGLASASGAFLLQSADSDDLQKEFTTKEDRRLRILRIYFIERRFLLRCTSILLQICNYQLPVTAVIWQGKEKDTRRAALEDLGKFLLTGSGDSARWLTPSIEEIRSSVGEVVSRNGMFEIEWASGRIAEACHWMEIIFQVLDVNDHVASSRTVLAWLQIVKSFSCFQIPLDDPYMQHLMYTMQSMAAVITVHILGVNVCLDHLQSPDIGLTESDTSSYIANVATIESISESMRDLAEGGVLPAGPAILAWSSILAMMRLRVLALNDAHVDGEPGSLPVAGDHPDIYEGTLRKVMSLVASNEYTFIEYLARTAVDNFKSLDTLSEISSRLGGTTKAHVSNIIGARMRKVILELLQNSHVVGVQYGAESLSVNVATLRAGQNYWDYADSPPLIPDYDTLATFLRSEDMVSNVLEARARFPLEPLPFLEICQALAACKSLRSEEGRTIIEYLEKIPTFTYTLPEGYSDYETINEEENNNSIRLTHSVDLFRPRRQLRRGYQEQSATLMAMDPDFCISAGTCGRIVSDGQGPRVVYLFHEYSGFKYLGKQLETFVPTSDLMDTTIGDKAGRDTVSAILSLLAHLLCSLVRSSTGPGNPAEALRILEITSSGLSRNRDIISVVFEILEEELQTRSAAVGSEASLELLICCIQVMHALTLITPGRVWSLLARSNILDFGRSSGKLPSIVGSIEMVAGRYELLLSCSHLYEVLVQDLATNAVSRRCRRKSSTRFAKQEGLGSEVPEHVFSKVLLSFTRYFIDVLESSSSWKFHDINESRQLRKTVTSTFNSILQYTYGIEAYVPEAQETTAETTSKLSSPKYFVSKMTIKNPGVEVAKPRLAAAFEAAATHLTESFLSTSTGTLRVQPMLRALFDGFATPDTTLFVNESHLCTGQTISTLLFTKTLLQIGALLYKPASQLQIRMFKASPLLARLYASRELYRLPVVNLFKALVFGASVNTTDPPSLLGHLGPRTAKNFLHVIAELDKPTCRRENFSSIEQFMSKVLSCRQQWFAKYLLTGKSAKSALESTSGGKKLTALDRPPLTTAFHALKKIQSMPSRDAIELLEFIAAAQNFWPWATYEASDHATFIRTISEFVGTLAPLQQSTSLNDSIKSAFQTKLVALIGEILSMHLFHSRQMGKASAAEDLIPNLDYFVRFAVKTPKIMEYNASLHGNLKRNFEARYSGCKLLEFRRTTIEKQDFGREYFYDLSLADKMLSFDQSWDAKHGFKQEVEKANVNLSCVNAQIALLHAWEYLAIELSTDLLGNVDLQSKLARVAGDCLVANTQSQGSEEIFQKLNKIRADLALVLIQRLVEAGSKVPEMDNLLTKIWDTVRQSETTFYLALASGDPSYHRTLLKIMFSCLRILPAANNQQDANLRASTRITQASPIVGIVIHVLDKVVAAGIRDIVTFIHEQSGDASPEDLALITGVLQSCLRVPGIELCYSQIVAIFEQNNSARFAITLFSWSDTLAIDGDPIYGELSILFLLELSTVPAMAEQLAIGGILGNISTANITTYLRGGKACPFAEGAGFQRCYSLWQRGILPLVLNLLDSVGAAIASEASHFLVQFPALLKQTIEALDPPASSRLIAKTQTKYITLATCSEAHTLSLIMFILNGFKDSVEGAEMADIKWDSAAMLDNAEFWLGSTATLKGKILPMGDRDVALFKQEIKDTESNRLLERIIGELAGIKTVLTGNI